MDIVSGVFFIFVAVTAALHTSLPPRYQNIILVAASLLFYGSQGLDWLGILLGLSLVTYVMVRLIKQADNATPYVWAGVIINIGMVLVFKYGQPYARFLPVGGNFLAQIVLPVGLSFAILQSIGVMVDAKRGRLKTPLTPIEALLLVLYFPKLLSGPIEQPTKFTKQLRSARRTTPDDLQAGLALMTIGLFRTVVLGGLMFAVLPPTYLNPAADYGSVERLAWLFGYGLYLYNNFAGYTNIVRGVSRLFGITLTRNFITPFFSKNVGDLWSKWHVSFANWLRGYIYYPISRPMIAKNPTRKMLNIAVPTMAVMLISGAWHEFNIPLIAWGGVIGVFVVLERLIESTRRAPPPERHLLVEIPIRIGVMFFPMLLSMVLFLSPTITDAIALYGSLWPLSLGPINIRIIAILGATLLLEWLQYRYGEFFLQSSKPLTRAFVNAWALLAIVFVSLTDLSAAPFVYQGF